MSPRCVARRTSSGFPRCACRRRCFHCRRMPSSPVSAPRSVIGFPSGAHRSDVKAAEAADAVANGADEVDMVIDLGLAKSGEWKLVEAEIVAVREAAPSPCVVKVIIESAVLDDTEIVAVCRAAEDAGADFVKTSTGFHPSGGATVHAVRLMAATRGRPIGCEGVGWHPHHRGRADHGRRRREPHRLLGEPRPSSPAYNRRDRSFTINGTTAP